MKSLQKRRRGPGLDLVDAPVPAPGAHEALVRVTAAGICGTDLHIYRWDKWSAGRIKPPVIVGHEFAGVVERVGSGVTHVAEGMRVSGEGHITCGHCLFCRTGRGHICREVEIIGVDRNGCFAEYMVMPADNLWPLPETIDDLHAAIFDPLGNAMHAVTAADVSGKSVMVTGAGAIGLFAVAIAKASGAAEVYVSEPDAYKRSIAGRLGADAVFDPTTCDVEDEVRERTGGLGLEVVLEMSGSAAGLRGAFGIVQNGGDVVLLGIPSGDVAVAWAQDIIFKGITIHAVNGRKMYDTWYRCQRFLMTNPSAVDPVITHVMDIADYEEGFGALVGGEAAKVVLKVGA